MRSGKRNSNFRSAASFLVFLFSTVIAFFFLSEDETEVCRLRAPTAGMIQGQEQWNGNASPRGSARSACVRNGLNPQKAQRHHAPGNCFAA